MRVIALPTDEAEARGIFGILHTACFQGEGPKEHAKARSLGKLQDVLEAVSHDGPPIADGMTPRLLNDGVTEIRLEDAHYEVLKERIFGAGVPWLASASRRVTAAYDLVAAAVEEKPGEAKKDDVVPIKRGKK
jgi:hypothetical protein